MERGVRLEFGCHGAATTRRPSALQGISSGGPRPRALCPEHLAPAQTDGDHANRRRMARAAPAFKDNCAAATRGGRLRLRRRRRRGRQLVSTGRHRQKRQEGVIVIVRGRRRRKRRRRRRRKRRRRRRRKRRRRRQRKRRRRRRRRRRRGRRRGRGRCVGLDHGLDGIGHREAAREVGDGARQRARDHGGVDGARLGLDLAALVLQGCEGVRLTRQHR